MQNSDDLTTQEASTDGAPSEAARAALENFKALLADADFTLELELLGIKRMAVGAVLRPSSRLTPQVAHKRSLNCWGERAAPLKPVFMERRCARACIRGMRSASVCASIVSAASLSVAEAAPSRGAHKG